MSKKKGLLLLIAMLVLLASCSGGIEQEEPHRTSEINESTVETMQYACDAVFFGDSITCDGNFDELFPNLRIVNLGVYGDTINDLRRRVQTLQETNPARIFLLVGINCLREDNLSQCVEDYSSLIGDIRSACPEAALHIQSVLPIGAEVEAPGWCTNETVRAFNAELEKLARSRGLPYIDLYSLYEKDGVLDPAKTRDGLHLNFNCYGPWAEAVRPYLTGNTP